MRSKTPLALMEQIIMVLVFALAAALCLRVFVWSDQASKRNQARDQASLAAQSCAEQIKHTGRSGGSPEEVLAQTAQQLGGTYGSAAPDTLELRYNADWTLAGSSGSSSADSCAYVLRAAPASSSTAGLCKVQVQVWKGSSPDTAAAATDVLFELEIAWQGGLAA